MSEIIEPRFDEDTNGIFKLVFKTSLLSFITLGIYRFWATTRVRQYLWGSVTIDKDPLEYTGTGMEKLLGFLMAIIILAIYLGIVQFLLTFVGLNFSFSEDPDAVLSNVLGIYISLFAVMPLLAFAAYRARRYKMSRTLWRGIRFGMDAAAWGYVWKWILCTLLQIVTLGIMTPYKTFKLEKYMADRSYFGSAKVDQQGEWKKLFPAMKHIAISIAILAFSGLLAYYEAFVFAGILAFIGYIWFIIGFVYYGVRSFAYLTSNKTIEGGLSLFAEPRTGWIVKKVILMSLALGLVTSILFGVVGGIAIGFGELNPIFSVIIIALSYIIAIAMSEALWMAWITMPILAHYIETSAIHGFENIGSIQQREADAGADAEGFADALDIGGAF